jgi:cytochrome c553
MSTKFSFLSILMAVLTVSATQSIAGDPSKGKQLAQSCATCHGSNGVATLAEAPNLAGQNEIYLVEQLRNFRNGKRVNEVMNVMSKPLSDEDIDHLAAWYSSISIQIFQKN